MENFKKYPLAERIFLVCFLIACTIIYINILFVNPEKSNASEINKDKSSVTEIIRSNHIRVAHNDSLNSAYRELVVAKAIVRTTK